jgi:hypothetical protein
MEHAGVYPPAGKSAMFESVAKVAIGERGAFLVILTVIGMKSSRYPFELTQGRLFLPLPAYAEASIYARLRRDKTAWQAEETEDGGPHGISDFELRNGAEGLPRIRRSSMLGE